MIWLTQDQGLLSERAQRALIAAREEGGLSIADITLRELAVLVARGRVKVSTSLEDYLDFVESLFRVYPIDAQIASRSMRFGPAFPKDPADRLIGATAVVHRAKLVTRDEAIRASGEVDCVW